MKGILIILLIFGLVLLAAVAFALVPNLMTPAAPTLPAPNAGGAATPTLAAAPLVTLPPAPVEATLPAVGGGGAAAFNGRFAGTLTSDDGSTAPVSLDLTQTGSTVAGDIAIGDGLTIDGGNCGAQAIPCLLYTSDAADERSSVDLGGRRIIKKQTTQTHGESGCYNTPNTICHTLDGAPTQNM